MLRGSGCPHVTVLGIRQCRSNDRPLLLQSCRDDTPCTDDQTIYEHHLSDRLWEHEGRVWIGRCRGGARFIPLQCARPNVLGIQPWSSNDRPPWLQSCRDNIPCTHDQAINEHVSDMLWGHGGQGKSGRRPGEGRRPFAVAVPMCWAFSVELQRQAAMAQILQSQHPMHAGQGHKWRRRHHQSRPQQGQQDSEGTLSATLPSLDSGQQDGLPSAQRWLLLLPEHPLRCCPLLL